MKPFILIISTAGLLAGCARDEAIRPTSTAAPVAAVVDSARSPAEELNRFRTELAPNRPDSLVGGATDAEALARSFVAAIAASDTAAVRDMLIDAAEFAYFYYPYTSFNHPPYQQAAGFVWMQLRENSEKGVRRVLQRWGGRAVRLESFDCGTRELQDLNVLHGDCGVKLAGDSVKRRWFGSILERGGRFKFLSYANDL